MLGVIVGCCSIVLMVSLGQGINEQNEKMLKSMGDLSIVTVYTNGYAGPMDDGGSSKMGDTKLDDKAVESFRAMSGVSGVTPMMNFPYNVTARAGAGGRYLYDYVQIMGIDMTSSTRWATSSSVARSRSKKTRCLPANGSPMVSWTP